ncbi:LIM domain transcription factor LMO4 isoform X1 [Myotis daubentonii]|uniref:LIM domain transcription factor LMO4 isoform X1 n=1 Tax=Myotis daubentonii TaxID=98922 RepID=UPI002872FB5E|nr:LIM domain transcription factor LMO4 isoform X1 [Myotis daubentonii]XP_059544942.1 LIM domain transcription factor LMO4 isoform X1 [Myotis daubentonii]XP_059544943.1 LIM domain transcription factor LMO4 isoform X1 [Myotis daubentonii]
MVNPGSSSQPPPVTAGSLSWKRCAGCGGKIADRFLLYAMDSYWHSRCLKCSCCQAQLGDIGTSCYTKSGMILCRNDYIRLFGNSGACSACGQSIPASELVMRAQGNVYHLKCFTCSTCRNRLVPGDRFHYINGSLFCEHDRPTALINGHLNSLQSNPLLPDQKQSIRNDGYSSPTCMVRIEGCGDKIGNAARLWSTEDAGGGCVTRDQVQRTCQKYEQGLSTVFLRIRRYKLRVVREETEPHGGKKSGFTCEQNCMDCAFHLSVPFFFL